MDERYHEGSRELQDRFDTRRLADRLAERTSRDHIGPEDRAFIERMDMFFLSWGNALGNPKVGPLFIDFVAERPTRLRVEGTASVRRDDERLEEWPEAQFVVHVRAKRVFPNCPRYIHRMALVERSSYVPRAGIVTPIPEWKRAELATGVLPKGDPAAKLDQPAERTRAPATTFEDLASAVGQGVVAPPSPALHEEERPADSGEVWRIVHAERYAFATPQPPPRRSARNSANRPQGAQPHASGCV